MGDRGYVVTFEQIDPLFTLDLADPTNPRIVGELKVPGFSTYLHGLAKDRKAHGERVADPRAGIAVRRDLRVDEIRAEAVAGIAQVDLPPLEWNRRGDGTFDLERKLPNGILFGANGTNGS